MGHATQCRCGALPGAVDRIFCTQERYIRSARADDRRRIRTATGRPERSVGNHLAATQQTFQANGLQRYQSPPTAVGADAIRSPSRPPSAAEKTGRRRRDSKPRPDQPCRYRAGPGYRATHPLTHYHRVSAARSDRGHHPRHGTRGTARTIGPPALDGPQAPSGRSTGTPTWRPCCGSGAWCAPSSTASATTSGTPNPTVHEVLYDSEPGGPRARNDVGKAVRRPEPIAERDQFRP